MKVIVNEFLCEGYGKCERVAPDLFRLDDAGIARLLVEGILSLEQIVRARSAANLCPTNAISLVDATTEGDQP